MKNNLYNKEYISIGFVNKCMSGSKTKIMNSFLLWYDKQVIHSLNYKDNEERLPQKIEEWSLFLKHIQNNIISKIKKIKKILGFVT